MAEQTNSSEGAQPECRVKIGHVGERSRQRLVAVAWFIVGPLVVALTILLCCTGWSYWRFGGIKEGIAFFNGYVIVAEQPTLNLGRVRVGSTIKGSFVLKNLTGESITLMGAKPECSCVVASNLPMQVSPTSSASFNVLFAPRPNDVNQHVVHRILLYLDVDSPPVVLTFTADVDAALIDKPQSKKSVKPTLLAK